jgi:hypothetical protein
MSVQLYMPRVGWYARQKWRGLVRMIRFINALVTISLNYTYYSAIAYLQNLEFTVAHALGVSVFTNRHLATDPNTEASTSNHYEILLPFLVRSLWNSTSFNTELQVAIFRELTWTELHLNTETCYICTCRYIASLPITKKTQPVLLKRVYRKIA